MPDTQSPPPQAAATPAAQADQSATRPTMGVDGVVKAPLADSKGARTAFDRAQAALDKVSAENAASAKPDEQGEGEKPAGTAVEKPAEGKDKPADKAEDKAEDGKAKEETSLSRSWAAVARKEASLREDRGRLKAEREEYQRRVAADEPDLAILRQVRAAVQAGKHGEALKILGVELQQGMQMRAAEFEEETPEAQTQRIAREVFAAEQKLRREAEEQAKAEQAKTSAAQMQAAEKEYDDGVRLAWHGHEADFPFLEAYNVQPEQVRAYAIAEYHKDPSKPFPSHGQALKLAEAALEADHTARAARIAARKPQLAAVPSTPTARAATDRPTTITPNSGDVAVVPNANKPAWNPNANARAEEALRRLGHA